MLKHSVKLHKIFRFSNFKFLTFRTDLTCAGDIPIIRQSYSDDHFLRITCILVHKRFIFLSIMLITQEKNNVLTNQMEIIFCFQNGRFYCDAFVAYSRPSLVLWEVDRIISRIFWKAPRILVYIFSGSFPIQNWWKMLHPQINWMNWALNNLIFLCHNQYILLLKFKRILYIRCNVNLLLNWNQETFSISDSTYHPSNQKIAMLQHH